MNEPDSDDTTSDNSMVIKDSVIDFIDEDKMSDADCLVIVWRPLII